MYVLPNMPLQLVHIHLVSSWNHHPPSIIDAVVIHVWAPLNMFMVTKSDWLLHRIYGMNIRFVLSIKKCCNPFHGATSSWIPEVSHPHLMADSPIPPPQVGRSSIISLSFQFWWLSFGSDRSGFASSRGIADNVEGEVDLDLQNKPIPCAKYCHGLGKDVLPSRRHGRVGWCQYWRPPLHQWCCKWGVHQIPSPNVNTNSIDRCRLMAKGYEMLGYHEERVFVSFGEQ